MSIDTAIVVPARLASTRFPRKLMHIVGGQPLILWTAKRIRAVAPDYPLFFAVAEEELAEVLKKAGFESVLTDPNLPSGTDRIAQANAQIGAKRIINVQADEPMVAKSHIASLARMIASGKCDMATLGTPFTDQKDFFDPNRVKVVRGVDGIALYFSRAPIPFRRDTKGVVDAAFLAQKVALLHLGMYAYTAEFLERFPKLPMGTLEAIEKLEQLRAMENGMKIAVDVTTETTVGIDAPTDVPILEARLRSEGLL
ncbi:MAG TPA: 3-deoxy-manno-octulosonate cytidylyltransferase [Opitutales bacterium]|nr:3-deoxy-manno-octulosonate cytidylyltransferase [Opitutales bacterium]